MGDINLGLQKEVPGTEDERPVKHGVAIGFEVDDVETSWREIQEKGAHVLAVPRNGDVGKYAEITDPDGHIIMLLSSREDE